MLTAKAFGMKVTRYFVGFGPTLWSFRRGETEYGVKGIPLGGFCKIVGMTPQDDDVDAGRRAAGDVALPGLEADDRDVRRLDHPLRPGRWSPSGSPRSPSACPTRTAPPPRRRSARSRRSSRCPTAWSRTTRARACAAGDPASPAAQAAAARRRPDHRGQRHADRQLRRAARRDPARAQAGRDRARSTYVRDGQPGTASTVASRRRSARRSTTRRATAAAVAALGVGLVPDARRPVVDVRPGRRRSAPPPTSPASWPSARSRR